MGGKDEKEGEMISNFLAASSVCVCECVQTVVMDKYWDGGDRTKDVQSMHAVCCCLQ